MTRKQAKAREAARLAHQAQRFDRGMHPDTHPEFWEGWKEPKFPKLPGSPRTSEENLLLLTAGAMLVAVGVFIGLRWKKAIAKRQVLALR